MKVAKVNKSTLTIENLEEAPNQEWIDENSKGDYLYIPYSSDNVAYIGLTWSPENGFEQQSAERDPEELAKLIK